MQNNELAFGSRKDHAEPNKIEGKGEQDSLIVELGLILPRGRFICASNEDLLARCAPGDEDWYTLCFLGLTNDDVDDAVVGSGHTAGQVGSDGVLPIGFLAPVLLFALDAAAGEARSARCATVGGCIACGYRGCLRVGGGHAAVDGREGRRDLVVLLLLDDGRWTWDACEVCIRVVHDARWWLSWAPVDVGDRDRRRGDSGRDPLAGSKLASVRVETWKVE